MDGEIQPDHQPTRREGTERKRVKSPSKGKPLDVIHEIYDGSGDQGRRNELTNTYKSHCDSISDSEWSKQAGEKFPEESASIKQSWDQTLQDYEKHYTPFHLSGKNIYSDKITKTARQIESLKNDFSVLYDRDSSWTEEDHTIARQYIEQLKDQLQVLKELLPKPASPTSDIKPSSKRLSSNDNEPISKLNTLYKDLTKYEFPEWHIEPQKMSTPTKIKRGDFLKEIFCGWSTRNDRPTHVNNLLHQVNDELTKMREVLQSSDFPYSLKLTISNQINADVQKIEQSYKQALKYDGYLAHQGRVSREKGETKLKELSRDLQEKVEGMYKVNEMIISDLNGLNEKINDLYKQFDSNIKCIKNNDENDELVKKELTNYQVVIGYDHWQFSNSCKKEDFLEAGKWAKRLMDEKEAFDKAMMSKEKELSRMQGEWNKCHDTYTRIVKQGEKDPKTLEYKQKIEVLQEQFTFSLENRNLAGAKESVDNIKIENKNFIAYLKEQKLLKIAWDADILSEYDDGKPKIGENKVKETFETLLQSIIDKLDNHYLPIDQGKKLREILTPLIEVSQKSHSQTIDTSKNRQSRARIAYLEQKLPEINQGLDKWENMHNCRAIIDDAQDTAPNEIKSPDQQSANEALDIVEKAYDQLLDCLRQEKDSSIPKQQFEHSCTQLDTLAEKVSREKRDRDFQALDDFNSD